MGVKYLLIRPDGSTKLGKTSWGKPPQELEYKELEATIRELLPLPPGCHLERVRVWFNDQYLDMFVDDYGKGLLPLNAAATAIYHANVHVHQPQNTGGLPLVCGPALIFFERVWY